MFPRWASSSDTIRKIKYQILQLIQALISRQPRANASRTTELSLVPCPCRPHDILQIRRQRSPPQQGLCELRIGNQYGRIACSAWAFNDRNLAADRLDRRNDLADRVSATGAQIYADAFPSSEEAIERLHMGGREIGDMDIISYCRAIARVVMPSGSAPAALK